MEQFNQANLFYDAAEYGKSTQLLMHLRGLDGKNDNGALLYNLGLNHYRLGEWGKSLYFFRRAMKFYPQNKDLAFNYEFVKKKVDGPFLGPLSWSYQLAPDLLFWMLTGLTFFLLLGTLLKRKISWMSSVIKSALILYSLLLFFQGAQLLLHERSGVVTVPVAKVYSAVGRDNVVLFELKEGSEFIVQDELKLYGDWVRLSLKVEGSAKGGEQSGWVKATDLIYDP